MSGWLDDEDEKFDQKDWAFLALLIVSVIFVAVAFA